MDDLPSFADAVILSIVESQSPMRSFVKVFRFLGQIFLLVMPLLFILKSPQAKGKPVMEAM